MSTSPKGRADYYESGGWNTVCYECGRKRKAFSLMRHWQGYYVCPEHWEARHPQDFVRGVQDVQTPPWTQPMPGDVFVPINWTNWQAENLPLADFINKAVTKVFGTVGTTDGVVNGRAVDVLAVNSTTSMATTNPEAVVITESILFTLGRSLTESLGLSEGFAKTITKVFAESIPMGETVQLNDLERTVESLALSESFGKIVTKALSESVAVSETFSTLLQSPTVLNGSALNSLRLG